MYKTCNLTQMPMLQTATTASSTKTHRLHRRFGYPSAKKLYRVFKHSGLARNSNSATAMAISIKAVPVKVYWFIGLVKRAYLALWRAYQVIMDECKDI
jgi:hypothetical protein